MKKHIYTIAILVILLILSVNVMAMDKLITVPVAELVGNKGFISGEIIGSSHRNLEGLYNISPSTAVGGVIKFNESRKNNNTELGVLAKLRLTEENEVQPVISAGLYMEDLYIVASKNLGYGFRGHFGMGNNNFGGLFLGFNKVLNPVSISQGDKPSLPIINLKGEYINEKVNFGVQMNLQDNMKINLGIIDFDELKVGLGYAF